MINKNRISVANPDLHNNQSCVLTTDINTSSSPITLNVSATTGFPAISQSTDYFFVLLGNYGDEKAEICEVTQITSNTLTVLSVKYSHSASETINCIPYDKLKIYGRAVSGGTNNLLATIDIDCSQQFTTYEYTGLDYSYFVSTYYRSIDTSSESSESDEISVNTFTFYTAKKIIEAGMRKAMVRFSENPSATLGWNSLLDLVNEGLNEILTRKKRWQCLHKVDSSKTTVANNEVIQMPSDMSVLEFLYVNGKKVDYISKLRFNQYVTGSLSSVSGVPSYYTIKNGEIHLYPKPSDVFTTSFEYYSLPETITSLGQEVKKEFAMLLVYFVAAQAAYINNNEKRGNLMEIKFEKVLEQQVEDVTGEEQCGDAQAVELTSVYGSYSDDGDLIF